MKICILAAGAAGMYCGSCMRDNALASALLRLGHQVTLVPLYSPIRTDAPGVSTGQVFFGGVNVYLQHATRLFRHTPRLLDWVFDRNWLLKLAGKYGTDTSPAKLGGFTLDVLRGDEGPIVKELRRLLGFLREEIRPDVVTLPNLMFVGAARVLREELKCPVIAELTGEDIFLDAMAEPQRTEARDLIRARRQHVDRFVATSDYYAQHMAQYLDVPRERIDVVYPGLQQEFLAASAAPPSRNCDDGPPTVGYLARICPEKGIDRLIEAVLLLKDLPGMADVRLRIAGYLGGGNRKWWDELYGRARAQLGNAITYDGEVDQAGKIALLRGIDVFSVPTAYPESKGIYLLEAMAHGLPVVQPAHGSFPELIARTGGGRLTPPGDAPALAAALREVLLDHDGRYRMGLAARDVVRSQFTDQRMAGEMLKIFQDARQ